jgi:class 3 adenylate cyclase/FixJ family two-component response regulator
MDSFSYHAGQQPSENDSQTPELSNEEWSLLLEHAFYLTRDLTTRDRLLAQIQISFSNILGCSRVLILLGDEQKGFIVAADSAEASKSGAPMKFIDAVKRSKVGVVLTGSKECKEADEPYFTDETVDRLVWAACCPLVVESDIQPSPPQSKTAIKVGVVEGVVYLENRGGSDYSTASTEAKLRLLCRQAAQALHHCSAFEALVLKQISRTAALTSTTPTAVTPQPATLPTIASSTAVATGEPNLAANPASGPCRKTGCRECTGCEARPVKPDSQCNANDDAPEQASQVDPCANPGDVTPEQPTGSPSPCRLLYSDPVKPWHVLVVDDDPITLKIMKNFLAPHYTTTLIDNAVDALHLLLDTPLQEKWESACDIVLCDIMMPNMSGYQFCGKLREKHPAHELPVIFMTAKNQVADIVEGFNCGGNDFLTKPVSRLELCSRIRLHISLAKINKAYSRFVPTTFLNLLGKKDIMEVRLGDQIETNMTVMFADVRSFTTMSEKMSPQENFEFINQLLSYLGPTVRENGGFIDKFVGDGIMALFPNSSRDALAATKEILKRLAVINVSRFAENKEPIRLGIGLHNGPVMLGCVGEHGRMDGTVIGDVVNVTFRIEELTKCFGCNILMSRGVVEKLEQEYSSNPGDDANNIIKINAYRYHGRVVLKGREHTVEVYEVFDGDTAEVQSTKIATKAEFEKAVELFEKGTRKNHPIDQDQVRRARRMFEGIAAANPEDNGARWYIDTCTQALELHALLKSSALVISPDTAPENVMWKRSMRNLLLPVEFPLLGLSPVSTPMQCPSPSLHHMRSLSSPSLSPSPLSSTLSSPPTSSPQTSPPSSPRLSTPSSAPPSPPLLRSLTFSAC